MQVEVSKYSKSSVWDSFVDSSNSGTIFHKLSFLSYHDVNKFKFHNLAFHKKNKLVAVLPGGVDNKVYKSPTGASYGSFATNIDEFDDYEELVDSFLKYAEGKNIKEVYLTPPPSVYLNKTNELERFILEYKGFKPKTHLITHSLDLEDINKGTKVLGMFQKRFRNDLNKSTRSALEVRFDNNIKDFYKILLINKKKFNAFPTHTYEELLRLKKLFPNDIKLLMAYFEKIPVAGILLFICNKSTVLTFYISHLYEYRDLKAVSRLLYEAVNWAYKQNFRWLDLGVSMDTSSINQMEPSRNLIFFKEGIGSKGFLRTTYCLQL